MDPDPLTRIANVCFDEVWEFLCVHGCYPSPDYHQWGEFCDRLHELILIGIEKAAKAEGDSLREFFASECAIRIRVATAYERLRLMDAMRNGSLS